MFIFSYFIVLHSPPCPWQRWLLGSWLMCSCGNDEGRGECPDLWVDSVERIFCRKNVACPSCASVEKNVACPSCSWSSCWLPSLSLLKLLENSWSSFSWSSLIWWLRPTSALGDAALFHLSSDCESYLVLTLGHGPGDMALTDPQKFTSQQRQLLCVLPRATWELLPTFNITKSWRSISSPPRPCNLITLAVLL